MKNSLMNENNNWKGFQRQAIVFCFVISNMVGIRDCFVLMKVCSRKGDTDDVTERRNTERIKFLIK